MTPSSEDHVLPKSLKVSGVKKGRNVLKPSFRCGGEGAWDGDGFSDRGGAWDGGGFSDQGGGGLGGSALKIGEMGCSCDGIGWVVVEVVLCQGSGWEDRQLVPGLFDV